MTNACTMYNEANPFVSVDKKMISSHNEWYIVNVLVCAVFFLQNLQMVPIVYALLRSNLDF